MDPNKILIEELRARIDSYFNIIVRNIRDSVPKAIGFFLVKSSQVNLKIILLFSKDYFLGENAVRIISRNHEK